MTEKQALCILARPVRVVIRINTVLTRVEVLCRENSQMLDPGEQGTWVRMSQKCSVTGETAGAPTVWGQLMGKKS